MSSDSQPKQYGLKESEQHMLAALQQQYNASMSLFLSFVAIERMAYNVTENTSFHVDGATLTITEHVPEADAPSVAVAGEEPKK